MEKSKAMQRREAQERRVLEAMRFIQGREDEGYHEEL
jgi:hypothetical protein